MAVPVAWYFYPVFPFISAYEDLTDVGRGEGEREVASRCREREGVGLGR